MSKKYIYGIFEDEHTLLHAIGKVRAEGHEIEDVLTPFPVHGMEDAMGWKRSRIPTAGFIFGALGTFTALSMMIFIHTISWPLNIGGKPFLALPAFIPITFELTVLFSAIGMVIVFLASCKLAPGISKPILEARATDDWFLMVFDITKPDSSGVKEDIEGLLKEHGAIKIKEKEV